MQNRLWSLTAGNFAIGTGVMIVPGMLNELSAGLAQSPARIGMLISAFAMTICLTGPVLASVTSAIERRRLLAAALALYALMHVLSALAPGYDALLPLRMATALGAAVFTSQAAATAGLMVAPAARGRAIGFVFLGWSIAAVIGAPLGAYLGASIGWRPTMALVGLLAAACAAWVWLRIPSGLFVAPMDRAAWKRLLADRPLLTVIAVTALQASGMFTLFAYMALLLKDFIGATPTVISLVLLCFGLTGVVGNIVAARLMDKAGPAKIGMVAMSCMLVAMLLWPASRGSLPITIALMLLWGLGCFSVNSAQQVRLVTMSPSVATASVSLNSSAIYLGQAAGAFIGGLMVASVGTGALSLVGAGFMAAALALSQLAIHLARRGEAARPA